MKYAVSDAMIKAAIFASSSSSHFGHKRMKEILEAALEVMEKEQICTCMGKNRGWDFKGDKTTKYCTSCNKEIVEDDNLSLSDS